MTSISPGVLMRSFCCEVSVTRKYLVSKVEYCCCCIYPFVTSSDYITSCCDTLNIHSVTFPIRTPSFVRCNFYIRNSVAKLCNLLCHNIYCFNWLQSMLCFTAQHTEYGTAKGTTPAAPAESVSPSAPTGGLSTLHSTPPHNLHKILFITKTLLILQIKFYVKWKIMKENLVNL